VGPTGRYVEPGDVEALARAIREVLAGKEPGMPSPREHIQRTFPLDDRRRQLLAAVNEVQARARQ